MFNDIIKSLDIFDGITRMEAQSGDCTISVSEYNGKRRIEFTFEKGEHDE